MTNQNNAAQAAEQDPLSDQFVNAVIRQHGYDSPEAVIARLWQWIGLNGSENGVTLLMYEAHKALSKLRAPVADVPLTHRCANCDAVFQGAGCPSCRLAAPVASAPVAGEARPVAVTDHQGNVHWRHGRKAGIALYAAPQASTISGEAVAWEIPNPHLGSELTSHKARADEARRLGLTVHELFRHAAPQASEAVDVEEAFAGVDRLVAVRDAALEEAAVFLESKKPGTTIALVVQAFADEVRSLKTSAALSAQPAAEPLSNPKQFALMAAENIRAGAPFDDPAFEALCREHGIWGTAEAALCAVFWRQAGQQRADATDWSAIAAEAQVERDAARAERDALIVERQQRAAGDERTAFEATYQADYDDPGAACEREHFGKGYRAGMAAQSAKEQNDAN